jgi:hypothetical protein
MRFFYLIILLYCSNITFGQPLDSLSELRKEEAFIQEVFPRFSLPMPNHGFFIITNTIISK